MYSGPLCRYTAWLAKQTQADVQALYVSDIRELEVPLIADLSGSLGLQPYSDLLTQLKKIEDEKAKLLRVSTLEAMQQEGVAVQAFHHRTGFLPDTLQELGDSIDAIALGKRGERAQYAPEHLGASLERVLRSVHKPILVSSRSYREIRRIVLAYDGGDSTRRAVDFLRRHPSFQAFDLRIVTVAAPSAEAEAVARVHEAEAQLAEVGYSPATTVLTGPVDDAIADYVVRQNIDLLMMGVYGHGRIRALLIGSTTTALIRTCHIPVLCFR